MKRLMVVCVLGLVIVALLLTPALKAYIFL